MLKHIAIAAAAVLALATPAQAQSTVDPEHIASLMKDAGYPAEFFGEQSAYRQIVSKAGNYEFTVEFFDCAGGKACETLLFYTTFKKSPALTKAAVDTYSGQQADGRMFLDKRGDPAIELELDLGEGMADAKFTETLKSWETMVGSYAQFLSGVAGPAAPAAAATVAEAAPATS